MRTIKRHNDPPPLIPPTTWTCLAYVVATAEDPTPAEWRAAKQLARLILKGETR